MSLTEKELQAIEGKLHRLDVLANMPSRTADDARHSVKSELLHEVPGLAAEVRRLNLALELFEPVCDELKKDRAEAIAIKERVEGDLLAMAVERDNLRKMLEDANQREQALLGVSSRLEDVRKAAAEAMRLRDIYQTMRREPDEADGEYFERCAAAWETVRTADVQVKAALEALAK